MSVDTKFSVDTEDSVDNKLPVSLRAKYIRRDPSVYVIFLLEEKMDEECIIKEIEDLKLNIIDNTDIPDEYYGCKDSFLCALIGENKLVLLKYYLKLYGLHNKDVLHLINFTRSEYVPSLKLIVSLGVRSSRVNWIQSKMHLSNVCGARTGAFRIYV